MQKFRNGAHKKNYDGEQKPKHRDRFEMDSNTLVIRFTEFS